MDKYLLEFKMEQARRKLQSDIEECLGTPTEQHDRLERLIEAAGQGQSLPQALIQKPTYWRNKQWLE